MRMIGSYTTYNPRLRFGPPSMRLGVYQGLSGLGYGYSGLGQAREAEEVEAQLRRIDATLAQSLDDCKKKGGPVRRRICKNRAIRRAEKHRKRVETAEIRAFRRETGGGIVSFAQGISSAFANIFTGGGAAPMQPLPPGVPPTVPRRAPEWMAPVAIGVGALGILLVVAIIAKRRKKAAT